MGEENIVKITTTIEEINAASDPAYYRLLKKYIDNDIIYKLDKKSEYNKYGKDVYIINPNLFRRDGELDNDLLEFFYDKRW